MTTLTTAQLEHNAEAFVNEYKNASDDEISKIVAGMTAIIEGNEASYERMKNQKWFERIWYGLTQKNKATVKEMQANRDKLTKYTIQILVKMNDLMNEHSECILDLYRAVAVVRRDLDALVGEVDFLAHKLNEKIESVDNYNFILTDIQNGKYNADSPLISLIDIMSLIDSRTANDTKKLIQLKETMEKAGFDFSKKIDIPTYSEEVLNIPEDKVGRILLFCQSFSHRSRFLAYTCSLMENYFYLGECDRQIVRESGEAIDSALRWSYLTNQSSCVLEGMYNDIKNNLPDSYRQIELTPNVTNGIDYGSATNVISEEKPISIVITGKVDCDKHTLAAKLREKYPFKIRITEGLSLIRENTVKAQAEIASFIENSEAKVVLYCVSSLSGRFEDFERSILKELTAKYQQVEFIIVLTKCVSKKTSNELKQYIQSHTDCNILCVLLDEWEVDDSITVTPFGIDELVNTIRQGAL